MPRKAFISDLNAAKAAEFAGITQIVSKEDGEFSFLVQPEGVSITICIMGKLFNCVYSMCLGVANAN